jgi:hypothetical protein
VTTLAALATLAAIAAGGALAAIHVVTVAHLGFGRFAAGSGGTVTIAPSGARSQGGGVVLLSSVGAAAGFIVADRNHGGGNDLVVISLPPNGSVVLRDGAQTMPVNSFTSNYPGGVMPGGRAQPFYVGATLHVAPNQAPGNYRGNFHITVNYQ